MFEHNSTFGLIAFAVCACGLPFAGRIARRWRVYDVPGPLKVHEQPVPRIGGAAMMAGLAAAMIAAWVMHGAPLTVLGVFAAIWLVGLADDVKNLPSALRLVVHLGAGALLWWAGWRLHWTNFAAFDLLATCLFVALLINAMNLLDGLDGLAAGTAAIAAAGFIFLLPSGLSLAGVVAWSLLGICVGMLLHNFPPARIFMGDSGSTLTGVLLAFLALDWVTLRPEAHSVALPLMFVALPVVDVALAMVRRLRGSASPFRGDRRHFYDLLRLRGWSLRSVLCASYGVTAALVAIGWLCARGWLAIEVAIPVVGIALAAGAHRLGSLEAESKVMQVEKEAT